MANRQDFASVSLGLVLDTPRIRRLRAALDELGYDRRQRALRGSFPRAPYPPYEEFTVTLRRVEPRARTWFDLLLLGRPVLRSTAETALGPALDDLLHLGVVEIEKGRVRSRGLALAAYQDRYVLGQIDPLYPRAKRPAPQVYIGPSSYRLAAELPYAHRLERVLDLGTGSGLLAILMAPSAKCAVATDIADDAVEAARFNAILNGVEDRVDVRRGDLFEPVAGERFDLVAFNAPFVASPPDVAGSPLAYGGEDGLRVLRPLLMDLGAHLAPGGFGLAYFESEGDRSGPVLAERLRGLAAGAGLDVEITLVNRHSAAERVRQLRLVHERRRQPLPPSWTTFYRARGLHHYYGMVARFRSGAGRVTTVNAIPRLY